MKKGIVSSTTADDDDNRNESDTRINTAKQNEENQLKRAENPTKVPRLCLPFHPFFSTSKDI
jgi:hypothetical protein